MYVVSEYAPGVIHGSLIDHYVGTGDVVGAVVPEPASLALLLAGSLAMLPPPRQVTGKDPVHA